MPSNWVGRYRVGPTLSLLQESLQRSLHRQTRRRAIHRRVQRRRRRRRRVILDRALFHFSTRQRYDRSRLHHQNQNIRDC